MMSAEVPWENLKMWVQSAIDGSANVEKVIAELQSQKQIKEKQIGTIDKTIKHLQSISGSSTDNDGKD